MHPVKFKGANCNLVKPANMSDEQCLGLPCEKNTDTNGNPYFLTAWHPNKEDLESMKNGNPLFLKIIGHGHPPVSLYTLDENGEGNF